jgi:hypothetical protein
VSHDGHVTESFTCYLGLHKDCYVPQVCTLLFLLAFLLGFSAALKVYGILFTLFLCMMDDLLHECMQRTLNESGFLQAVGSEVCCLIVVD